MSAWRSIGRYGTVGFELIAFMAAGFYGGRFVETRMGFGKGWMTLAGFFLGLVAGFANLFKAAKALERDAIRDEKNNKDGLPYADEYLELVDRDKPKKDSQAPHKEDP